MDFALSRRGSALFSIFFLGAGRADLFSPMNDMAAPCAGWGRSERIVFGRGVAARRTSSGFAGHYVRDQFGAAKAASTRLRRRADLRRLATACVSGPPALSLDPQPLAGWMIRPVFGGRCAAGGSVLPKLMAWRNSPAIAFDRAGQAASDGGGASRPPPARRRRLRLTQPRRHSRAGGTKTICLFGRDG